MDLSSFSSKDKQSNDLIISNRLNEDTAKREVRGNINKILPLPVCPLSLKIITDPVFAADNYTY